MRPRHDLFKKITLFARERFLRPTWTTQVDHCGHLSAPVGPSVYVPYTSVLQFPAGCLDNTLNPGQVLASEPLLSWSPLSYPHTCGGDPVSASTKNLNVPIMALLLEPYQQSDP